MTAVITLGRELIGAAGGHVSLRGKKRVLDPRGIITVYAVLGKLIIQGISHPVRNQARLVVREGIVPYTVKTEDGGMGMPGRCIGHLGQFHPIGDRGILVSFVVRQQLLTLEGHRYAGNLPGGGYVLGALVHEGELDFLALEGTQGNIAALGQFEVAVRNQPFGNLPGLPGGTAVFRNLDGEIILRGAAAHIGKGVVKIEVGIRIIGEVYLRGDEPALGLIIFAATSLGGRCLCPVLGIGSALELPDFPAEAALVLVLHGEPAQAFGKVLLQDNDGSVRRRIAASPTPLFGIILATGHHLESGRK